MPAEVRPVSRHRLKPHERWFVWYGDRVRSRRPEPRPGSARWRFLHNYGRDGDVLLGAAIANLIADVTVSWAAMTLVIGFGSTGRFPLSDTGSLRRYL